MTASRVALLHELGQHFLADLLAVMLLDDLGRHLARAKALDLRRLADRFRRDSTSFSIRSAGSSTRMRRSRVPVDSTVTCMINFPVVMRLDDLLI